MLPHPLANFEIQKYYQNEPKFIGVNYNSEEITEAVVERCSLKYLYINVLKQKTKKTKKKQRESEMILVILLSRAKNFTKQISYFTDIFFSRILSTLNGYFENICMSTFEVTQVLWESVPNILAKLFFKKSLQKSLVLATLQVESFQDQQENFCRTPVFRSS